MFTDYDVVIIGSGCAGLSASIYTARAGLETIVYERGSMGGETSTRTLIENYPGFAEGINGPDLAAALLQQSENAGAEVEVGEVTGIVDKGNYKIVNLEDDKVTCKAVIVASGSLPRLLNVPGEAELTNKGVFYCETCDGPICAGKPVLIAGAGDSGLTAALFMAQLGSKVTVAEFLEKPKASQVLLDRAEEAGIEIICNKKITKIEGPDWVTGVQLEDHRRSGCVCPRRAYP